MIRRINFSAMILLSVVAIAFGQASPNPSAGTAGNPGATSRPDATGNLDRAPTEPPSSADLDRPRNLQSSTQLLGGRVTRNGQPIGRVEDLMVDVESGRIAYGINSFNNVRGATGNLYPVPWRAGRYSDLDNTYELDVRDERITDAPSFPAGQWPNFRNDDFANRVHGTYGQSPYWTETDTVASFAENPRDRGEAPERRGTTGTTRSNATGRDNNRDRNGTRGTDVPGSERVVGGQSRTRPTDEDMNAQNRAGGATGSTETARKTETRGRTMPTTGSPGSDRTTRAVRGGSGDVGPAGRTVDRRDRDTGDQTTGRTDDTDRSRSGAPILGSGAATVGAARDRLGQGPPANIHRMSEIRGSQIMASDGTRLGTVDELVVDPATGRIAYAVAGDTQRRIPIPWSALQPGTGNTFQLKMDAAKFRNAPTFRPDERPNLASTRWSDDLQRFYGIGPYWETNRR